MMTTKLEASLLCNEEKGIATTKEMEASLVPNVEKGEAVIPEKNKCSGGHGCRLVSAKSTKNPYLLAS